MSLLRSWARAGPGQRPDPEWPNRLQRSGTRPPMVVSACQVQPFPSCEAVRSLRFQLVALGTMASADSCSRPATNASCRCRRRQWARVQLSAGCGTKSAVPGSGKKQHLGLLPSEPAVVLFRQASLIIRNLRTKGREDVGWGYTNRTAEVNPNEAGNQQLTPDRNVEGSILDKRLAVA